MRRLLLLLAFAALPGLALPDVAPDVTLEDVAGRPVKLSRLAQEKPVCLVWWCSTCPSCRAVDARLAELARTANVYAVCASAGETASSVEAFLKKQDLQFPVLFDRSWALTEPFAVKATTTTLILDGGLQVRYFGRFVEDQQNYARDALSELAQGQPVSVPRTRPFGCVIPRPTPSHPRASDR